jgi:hypothetical protein
MPHPTTVGSHDMPKVAAIIANLRYDALAHFLQQLSGQLNQDAILDERRDRPNLAIQLRATATRLTYAAQEMDGAWEICKVHMNKEETMTRDNETIPAPTPINAPFDTESDYKKHSTAHLRDHSSPNNSAMLVESIFFQKLLKELNVDTEDEVACGFAFKSWQRVKAIAPLFAKHLMLVTPVVEQMIAIGRASIFVKHAHDIMLVEMRLRELRSIE